MENFKYIKKFKKANFIQFSPKGNYIISVSGNQITVFDTKTLDELYVFKELKQPGKIAFAFNNEKLFASESSIKKLGIFNLYNELSAKIYKVTKSDDYQDYNICFSTDNKKIIFGIYNVRNNSISTFDIETSEVKNLKTFENSFVKKIEYCENDDTYLFSILDRDGHLINGENYPITYILKWKYPFELNEPIEIKTQLTLTWSDISYNSAINQYAFYDWDSKSLIMTDDNIKRELSKYVLLNNRSGYFSSLNWSNDGEYIAITFLNNVKIIRTSNAECIKELKVTSGLYSEFSPDGRLLLIGTANNSYLVDNSEFLK